MNKKGQLGGIIAVFGVILMLIILAPIILRVGTEVLDKTSTQLQTIDATNNSANQVTFVKNQMTGTFDWVIMFLIMFNILLLLISSFLIDVHPSFLVIYIIGCFILVITLPYSISVAERIYGMSQFNTAPNDVISYIPMTQFILNNFGSFLVGIIVLTGIIIYGKIRYSSQGGGGVSY